MSHVCDACIVTCIDFRFQDYVRKFTNENLAGKKFDLIGWAGSTKNLDLVMGQIDISVRLHQIKQVILIHHEECGAYGAESTPERHAIDLKMAREKVLAAHPQLQVELYYLKLDGTFEQVN